MSRSFNKQMGGSAAMGFDLAKQMEGDKKESSEEIVNYNNLHGELVQRYTHYYVEKGLKYTDANSKAIDYVNRLCGNKSEKEKIKILKNGIKLFTNPSMIKDLGWKMGIIAGAKKKKKKHKKKGSTKGGKKSKHSKQGGGKSRKPKKAKHSRKKKKSRSRRPKRMRTPRGKKRAGAGDNPYPLMFDPYDTYDNK